MGVLQRFERRLESLVEGTFARVFKGEVQPVEVAKALQRETDDKKAVVSQGRVLVPNDFVVELGPHDHERLSPYAEPLATELAAMVREHAAEQAYSFVADVHVVFEETPDLDTGVFRIRSGVTAGTPAPEGGVTRYNAPGSSIQAGAVPAPPNALPGRPKLSVSSGEKVDVDSPAGMGVDEAYFLTRPVTVIGRGQEADIRLSDAQVSRRHAEIRMEGDIFLLADLGSTNGTTVNGVAIGRREIVPGDRIGVGGTVLLFDREID